MQLEGKRPGGHIDHLMQPSSYLNHLLKTRATPTCNPRTGLSLAALSFLFFYGVSDERCGGHWLLIPAWEAAAGTMHGGADGWLRPEHTDCWSPHGDHCKSKLCHMRVETTEKGWGDRKRIKQITHALALSSRTCSPNSTPVNVNFCNVTTVEIKHSRIRMLEVH